MAEPEQKGTAMARFKGVLDKPAFKSALQGVAAANVTPERLVRVALAAISRTPILMSCTPLSVAGALMEAAEMGLEAGGGLGHGYLVPFKNKHTGWYEAKFIPGYRGLCFLALRDAPSHKPIARKVDAWLVHEKDVFSRVVDDEKDLVHFAPAPFGTDAGKVIGGIARAILLDGTAKWIEMTEQEIQHVRSKSRAKDNGPWVTDTDEMRKKTLLRRLCKNLPIPPDAPLGKALSSDLDGEQLDGEDLDLSTVAYVEPEGETVQGAIAPAESKDPPKTLAEAAEKLGKKAKAKKPEATPPEAAATPPEGAEGLLPGQCGACYSVNSHAPGCPEGDEAQPS